MMYLYILSLSLSLSPYLSIYIYIYARITDPSIYPILIFFEVTRYITGPESSVVLVKGVVLPGILGIGLSSMS